MKTPRIICSLTIGALFLAMTTALPASDKLPEVSKDGLHLMKNTKARAVYVKPGASLGKYTKVKMLDCFVDFKKNWERDYNLDEVGLGGKVTDKDAVQIKNRLAAEFKKIFADELQTKGGYQIVDDIGPDTLLIRPAIINLDVSAVDTHRSIMVDTLVASAGEMTLFMELYDSATSTLLARVVDPQAGQEGAMARRASSGTNREQADEILRRWADLLRSHLGELKN